jgi:hypothetical protein
VAVERMLRFYFSAAVVHLSELAVEESLDESVPLRGFVKVSYRGIAKNGNRLFATCALGKLFLALKKLLGTTAV